MKIGLSYSRCVRDIIDGRVDIDNVLVVIARTDFDPHNNEQWQQIWKSYYHDNFGSSNPEWRDYLPNDEDRFRSVSIELWESGKLHQPRKFGINPIRLPYHWLETALPSEELDRSPAAKAAWEQFQTVAGLTGVKFNKDAG